MSKNIKTGQRTHRQQTPTKIIVEKVSAFLCPERLYNSFRHARESYPSIIISTSYSEWLSLHMLLERLFAFLFHPQSQV